MTRRTTVITPTTQTDAVYELPSQPFARRVVSASVYYFDAAIYHFTFPELKIADVEGNVLAAVGVAVDLTATTANPVNWYFADLGGSQWNLYAPIGGGSMPVYLPATIPPNLIIPESNLFTLTLWGSVVGDTIPNLVLVTEDADEDFMIA